MTQAPRPIHVGVLALQGAFNEHTQLLKKAFGLLGDRGITWSCAEIRTPEQLVTCDALIIPGGESTTIALVAERSGLLEPLRSFVKVDRKPVWGTCAGMILLSEAANRTKQGGQDLIGGLDVRVNRNYFGRQVESFEADLSLPFLGVPANENDNAIINAPFRGVFIRAPVVERVLPAKEGVQDTEEEIPDTVIAPSRTAKEMLDSTSSTSTTQVGKPVEVLATLPGRGRVSNLPSTGERPEEDVIAVRQGNVLATSFHPELTDDPRIHVWWLAQILDGSAGAIRV